ncbi:MAG: hypothetical protein IT532_15120 [Burkholderiales bacterium]|nr:hypothetical protein [Burkholderiales bacterium]
MISLEDRTVLAQDIDTAHQAGARRNPLTVRIALGPTPRTKKQHQDWSQYA